MVAFRYIAANTHPDRYSIALFRQRSMEEEGSHNISSPIPSEKISGVDPFARDYYSAADVRPLVIVNTDKAVQVAKADALKTL